MIIDQRQHEVRIGMSVYWVKTWKNTAPELKDGFEWSALDGRLAGFSAGTRAEALKEAREGLAAREALINATSNGGR